MVERQGDMAIYSARKRDMDTPPRVTITIYDDRVSVEMDGPRRSPPPNTRYYESATPATPTPPAAPQALKKPKRKRRARKSS